MKLVLRADDLGISQGVNYGIQKSIQDGLITCVGIMPNMEDAIHGYSLIKDLDVCIGQHTNICLGKPVLDSKLIPSLVDKNGYFYTSHDINNRPNDTIDVGECELEIEAQVLRFQEITGYMPKYLDGHAVFSMHYLEALERIAEKYNLFYVNPLDDNWSLAHGMKSLGYINLDENGLYNPRKYFEKHLDDIKKNQCSIAVFHPGYLDQYILTHSSYTLIRPMECEFLCSDWLKKWIQDNEIELIDFHHYINNDFK